MNVKLIAITTFLDNQLDEKDRPTNLQEIVAYVARVSNPANQAYKTTSSKLVRYLIKQKHWSPFQMVNVVLEVNSSRAITRQILRHQSIQFQEFSQRYATVDSLSTIPFIKARLQDSKNRQNSLPSTDEELNQQWIDVQMYVRGVTTSAYQWALSQGIAKEVARSVLAEGLTPSRLYANGSLRSWIHYIQARTDKSTQLEHRLVAEAVYQTLLPHFPLLKEIIN